MVQGRMVDPLKPRSCSNSVLEMAESSFLCASSDGMLWNLAKCTDEGEWTTENIWEKKEMPEPQTPGSDSSVCSEFGFAWQTTPQLKTRQRKKVSLRERSQILGRRL